MKDAARQMLRALRGHRSQLAFSRRLGYRGNVVAKWEAGKRSPTLGEFFRAAMRVGVDVPAALERFHAASAPAWSPDDPHRIAEWLSAMRGGSSQMALAEQAGLSRQQVGRLLSGRSKGHLPEGLALVDAMTGRLPDLVAELVDIDQVPSLARQASVRHALERLAFEHPWSSAAQAWLGARRRVPVGSAARQLAEGLGLPPELARTVMDALLEAGVAEVVKGYVRPAAPSTVEVRATPDDMTTLRTHWASVGAERVRKGEGDDLFSFNVFACSRDDLERIRLAQRRFYREVRAVVADSPAEVVVLLTAHTGVLGG